ncbi:C40 family peptidase [Gulosibacter sp. 10]|uniref:C40 family peptidase n=1 Tax=Gulosibacter sp. 10 TaxID=1255570 RepID=UPI00097E9357|nr:C40 family peptidase [Gulosibacter sp. 10]SJM71737.1 NLP/P60 family protein [Gulosibacter sp. 10]
METTTLNGTAPLTRREAREIERRTGVRPLAAQTAVSPRDTGEIARNDMDALVSVLPTEIVERITAPIAEEQPVAIPEAFDARPLTVRAARPAALVAQRRRRAAGGFAAAASVTAIAAAGLTAVGGQNADIAAADHQANLLNATTQDETELPEQEVAEEEAAVAAPPQEIQVDSESTSVETFDSSLVQTAATEVVVETPEPEPEPEPTTEETSSSSSESSSSSSSSSSSAPASSVGANVVETARANIGVGTYQLGGNTPAGWDCSGFVQWVFAQHGVSLPHSVTGQAAAGTQVSDPQPGDLVIFGGYHVGIYVGNGQMIDSPNWGRSIEIGGLDAGSSYYFVRI